MTWRFGPDFPDHLRAWSLTVVEVDGWHTRGVLDDDGDPLFFPAPPEVLLAHHTATSAKAPGDYPSLGIVRDGRTDLPGPLSQLGLGRSGTAYVIAAGKANHAGAGDWEGITASSLTVGIEAESPGDGTWTPEQLVAYPLLAAAVLDYLDRPASRLCGHREWANPSGRKPDPTGIDLPAMRATVAQLLATGPQEDAMNADQEAKVDRKLDALQRRVDETADKVLEVHAGTTGLHAKLDALTAAALTGALLSGGATVTQEQVEVALRNVLGSLDGAPA